MGRQLEQGRLQPVRAGPPGSRPIDYARGKRCYFERVQDLVNDFKRFVKLVRQEVGQELPTFLLGMSMGGFVVVNAAMQDENLADGVVLLATDVVA